MSSTPSPVRTFHEARAGVGRADLLVVNKTDLAPHVGVDLALLEEDTQRARGARPYVMARLRQGAGVQAVVDWLQRDGGLELAAV